MKNLNILKPSKLDVDPNSPTASKEWKHWHRSFTNFIEECGESAPDKFKTLVNCVSFTIYDHIEECSGYESAIKILQQLYVKTPNEIMARHLLATRKQHPDETLDEYMQELQKLSKDCNIKTAVTAEQYRQELVRDAFINGIASPLIKQRLLENKVLDLENTYNQAYIFDLAQRNIDTYASLSVTNAIQQQSQPQPQSGQEEKQSSPPPPPHHHHHHHHPHHHPSPHPPPVLQSEGVDQTLTVKRKCQSCACPACEV
uniref:Retrotransposon gag domain-containing protein n=1 Tax=Penaeus monodon majanivirus B TaxID=2984272 RepID=A0A9C7C7M8_9VIRU|nr:MAG: hypothetical protein [Penaeus monodon majanivirus B]